MSPSGEHETLLGAAGFAGALKHDTSRTDISPTEQCMGARDQPHRFPAAFDLCRILKDDGCSVSR